MGPGSCFLAEAYFQKRPRGACFCFFRSQKNDRVLREARAKKKAEATPEGLLLLFRSQKNHRLLRETRAKKKAKASPRGTGFCFFRSRKKHSLLEGPENKKKEHARRKAYMLFLKTSFFFPSIQMNFQKVLNTHYNA